MKYEQYLKTHNDNSEKLEKELAKIEAKIEALQLEKQLLKINIFNEDTSNFAEYKKQLGADTQEEIKKLDTEKEKFNKVENVTDKPVEKVKKVVKTK